MTRKNTEQLRQQLPKSLSENIEGDDGFIEVLSIGDIAEVFDGPHATPKKLETGPYFLSISSLNKGTLDLSQSAHLSEQDFQKWTKRVTPQPGDVLFSYETRLGEAAIMPPGVRACLGRRMGLLRPDQTKVIPEYLLYAYLSPAFQNTIEQRKIHGATVDRIALRELPSFPVRIPGLAEQRTVVDNLKALDAKIQLNHHINQTLEQMAQAIFKSWFVDFEPVKAKIAALEAGGSEEDALLAAMQAISGKGEAELARLQTEQPEQHAELRATAELFPSAMQDSELGEIPEGWAPTRLERHIELAYGKALKKSARVKGQYPVYGSGGVTGSHNTFLVPGPGIIIGRKGTVGSIYWESNNFYPIDTTFYVTVKNGYSLSFAYYLLKTLGLSDMNTDAAVPGLNRNNVYRLEVPSFPEAIVNQFSKIVASISEQISASHTESRTLTELRDCLLPKLLSGELAVSDTDNQFMEVKETADV